MTGITPDDALTPAEAAAHLGARSGEEVAPGILELLSLLGRGPVGEELDGRRIYRRPALDEFLRTHGSDPRSWIDGWSAEVIARLRSSTSEDPAALLVRVAATLDRRDTAE